MSGECEKCDSHILECRCIRPSITWTFPLKVESTANLTGEPRYAKTKRKNKQYLYLWTAFANQTGIAGVKRILPYPCMVRMTRGGKKKLDPDNLQFAFKYIRDEIASFILPGLARGKADDDPKIKWEYTQEISKMYFCKIEFFDGN
jgi:hypothetical protein